MPICSFDGGKVVANLPPDIPVPASSHTVETAEVQEADKEVVNQDEEEALPEASELEEAERNPVKKWMRKSQ